MRYLLFIVAGILGLVSCRPSQHEGTNVDKPNVLFILVDDYGYTDCGIMGSKYYETPNVDRIAREGMIFTDGYATCQVCSPSRASILTGKFTARHGITDWIGAKTGEEWSKIGRGTRLLPPDYKHVLDTSFFTLPEAMRQAGYVTFFAGKWHLGGKGSWPEDHGFDINVGGWDAGSPRGGYFSPYKNPNLPDGPVGENLSLRLARETSNFIRANKDRPFFAYLSFYAVHGPIETTREKWAKYRDKAEQMGIAPKGFEMGHFLPIRQFQDNPVYGGLVETMDDAVGMVLNTLDELGLADNTIVCFTGDNGGVVAGDAYSTSNKPLRGGKGYQFEGGIREPYFIKVPWLDIAGKRCSTPVSGTDFYPTILELCGLPLHPHEHNDGVSLLPLLRGDTIAERPLIWHYPHYGNQGGEPSSIIRLGDWKLIHYYEDGHDELYNLKDDLSETNNLADRHPEKVKHLRSRLFATLEEMGARYPKEDPTWTPQREAQWRKNIVAKKLPALEKQRLRMLSKDFDPGNNWWGSLVPED